MGNEISELQAIDFAFGAFIAGAFSNASTDTGPKDFQEFMARPTNQRIYRHDYEDPKSLINAIQGARKTEKTVSGKISNLPTLPVVAYNRKPGLSNDEGAKTSKLRSAWNEELNKAIMGRVLPVFLEYRILFVAWDKASLDKISLLWFAHVTTTPNFPVIWSLGGEDFETMGIVKDHVNVSLTDVSPPRSEAGRLLAVEGSVSVSTQILFGEVVILPDEVELHGALTGYIK